MFNKCASLCSGKVFDYSVQAFFLNYSVSNFYGVTSNVTDGPNGLFLNFLIRRVDKRNDFLDASLGDN